MTSELRLKSPLNDVVAVGLRSRAERSRAPTPRQPLVAAVLVIVGILAATGALFVAFR
jgi:hypothetical protein